MSGSLWKKTDFSAISAVTPRDIIQEQCAVLNQMTEGRIIGRVVEYNKRVDVAKAIQEALIPSNQISNNDTFAYEFFITSMNTPKYKFRVCIVEYGIMQYPILFTLDTEIANEIGIDDEFTIDDMDKFTECLSTVLNSEKLEKVISGLLAFNGQ